MRKVLIVDDEKLIRKGIRTILERNFNDLDEIKEASNGKEALDILFSEKIDILILDIRLPQIDGISVLKKIQNLQRKPKVVIISGYDEFSYAKECMQYGAKGYILKPIDKKELIEIVEKVKEEIVQEENNLRLISFQRIMKLKMLEAEINNIIFSGLEIERFKERLKELEIPIEKKVYSIYVLRCGDVSEQTGFGTEEERVKLSKILSGESYISTIYNHRKDILVLSEDTNCFENIGKIYLNNIDKRVYIGICDLPQYFDEIKKLYENSFKTAIYAFASNKNIEFWSSIKWREEEKINKFNNIEKLKELILAGKQKEAISCLENVLCNEFFMKSAAEDILNVTKTLYSNVVEWFCHHVPKKVLDFHEYQKLSDIFNFSSVSEYVNYIKKFVHEATEIVISLKGILSIKDEIDEAIKFINLNYHKDINMAMVANHVSLNYYYFSSIFKEKTGMSFLDYLNKVRVEKAKELLAKTDLKVWEIASKVGYKNPKHFARIFKEITGLTPNEYRDVQKSLQE
ncbi:response regulator transcription factor [Caldicellulosiruptor sp. DIB 104C]|uniref:response regulator transcription factor n=1 Tax=Caldicellulosiruptor sp. DIB 104C TaxID=3019889 RepID=UPI002304E602|nr:response regulator [Caldicellulosiruptor sp. DIB 104C]